jgi:hypothetical protein
MNQAHSLIIAEVYGPVAPARTRPSRGQGSPQGDARRAEASRTSGIHGTAAARFGGTIDQRPARGASSAKLFRGAVGNTASQGSGRNHHRLDNFLPMWGGSARPVTTRARRRSSGSVSRQSPASPEPAFVRAAWCNSSRPHGRGRDQDPRVEDDRWHTNASRRLRWHRGRWQMPTGGGNGRARGEGRRDVGPAARRAGTTCPKSE